MSFNQNNLISKKIEEIKLNSSNNEESLNKYIKKLDSSILDRIEKKGTNSLNLSVPKKSVLKEIEQKELENIEKLTTFKKIIKLQKLLKEMISKKKTFENNKNEMIEKINQNCFNYYKNKIGMKEIYDYCKSKKFEEHIDYKLINDPQKYFNNDTYENLFDDLHNFIFKLRNNNKLMIYLIDNCKQNDFENLSDFLINFFYEDTINSSFIQEELMLIIYLIFEKNIYQKLQIDNIYEFSHNIFRNETNFIYYILKSLSRKADIRNFFCSILLDSINKLQGIRKYLSPDIFHSDDFEENEDIISVNENNHSKDENYEISKSNTVKKNDIMTKLRLSKKGSIKRLNRFLSNENKNMYNNIINENNLKIKEENSNNIIKDNNNGQDNNIFNCEEIYNLSENISEEELNKINLDSFFENNNVTLNFIQNKMKEYENFSKNSLVNLVIKDYLNLYIKDIKDSKEEIYSNQNIIKFLKLLKIKIKKEEGNNNEKKDDEDNKEKGEKEEKKEGDLFKKMIEMVKNNYFNIIEIIDEIINKLKENITSVPVIIKCISKIIDQFFYVKFNEKKQFSSIDYSKKYIFKSYFFIGNFLLSELIDPDYNGIYSLGIISKTTSENLKLIHNVLDELLSGKLFTNGFQTLFNKYIIETIPKIFEIIDYIEKNFHLPDILQRLINTCNDINNEKRLNDFEYDYFFEKDEEIQYQSTCLNMKTLCLLINLTKKSIDKIQNEEDKNLIDKIFSYEKYLNELYEKNLNAKKIEYICFHKLNFNKKINNKINSIQRDFFSGLTSENNNEISYFKKCLTEVLSYINILNEESFLCFTDDMKNPIHNYNIKYLIYKKKKKIRYNSINNDDKEIKNIFENSEEINQPNFKNLIFKKILEYIKYEIGNNNIDNKNQRIIFCAVCMEINLKILPKEYIENNYSKLFMELIKETKDILNFLNNNILNKLFNKVKEGNKLNLIIKSNYFQIKNLEKFKCIEYLYHKILLPIKFNIEKDKNGIISKIEYIEEKEKKKEKEISKEIQELIKDFVIIDKEPKSEDEKPKQKKELIKTFIEEIPDFRNFENSSDDIIKIEENCGMPKALKKYFVILKKEIKKEKILKRFKNEDIESISVELENYILFKLYDKLYPTKQSKEDIKFYNKCTRLDFIKPENLISDKNIYIKNYGKCL